MEEKVLLGRIRDDIDCSASGEFIWLSKHKWDCGWYWGFGYVGNKNCHFHFDHLLYVRDSKGNGALLASELFTETCISDADWWVIRDLMVQAYALKAAAEVYRYGGRQTTLQGVTDLIRSPDMAKTLNDDLERVLTKLWEFTLKATST